MAESNLIVKKNERGFFEIKRDGKGPIPAELAGKSWTMEREAGKALIAYHARQEASENTEV